MCSSSVQLSGPIIIVIKHHFEQSNPATFQSVKYATQQKYWRSEEGNLSPMSLLSNSVSLQWCFMCEAYSAHLDTEKIYAACLALSEEQSESDSCFPKSRIVQGKSETHSTGEGGWKGCSAINEGSFTRDGHSSSFLLGLQQGHSLMCITDQLDLEVFAQERP